MRFAKGYRIVEVSLGVGAAVHTFYIKEHSDKNEDSAKGRTMFVGNVDYCCDMSHVDIDTLMRDLFGEFGSIESVSVSSFKDDGDISHSKTRFAHVTFSKKNELKMALNASEQLFCDISHSISQKWGFANSFIVLSGSELAKSMPYVTVDPKEVKEKVYQQLKDFEEREELDNIEKTIKTKEPDQDGFIEVVSRSKRKRTEDSSSTGAGSHRSRGNKKKDGKELKNFYRFQVREQQREKLWDLRKKFEEDKAKIAVLKQARKFKPF